MYLLHNFMTLYLEMCNHFFGQIFICLCHVREVCLSKQYFSDLYQYL